MKNLIQREDYTQKVLPFLKPEYFSNSEDRILFKEIAGFVLKYNTQPTYDALMIEVDSLKGSTDDTIKSVIKTIGEIEKDTNQTNIDWLVESTEKFCQERAIFNAMTEALEIMNGKGKHDKGAIPELLSDALAITFDPNVGHDFLEQTNERFEYYHRHVEKMPFDIDVFNKATKNGVSKKTLNLIMGGVHTGKTLFLCHLSAWYLVMGKSVLYITLEMAEEEIAKRIEANTLNIAIDDLLVLSKDMYDKKVERLKQKTQGKLIIKEFPATSATVVHIKALLNELRLKKNFVPDVIMIDYLNLMASSRIRASGAQDTYTYVKSIAEEVRGLAQQSALPIWSATQLNRAGYNSSDPDMTDTAESFGLPATLDLQWVLVASEQMKALNQIMVKQLKNRYDNLDNMKRFVIGVDKSKMTLYDVETSAQDLSDTGQEEEVVLPKPKFGNNTGNGNKFKGLKV